MALPGSKWERRGEEGRGKRKREKAKGCLDIITEMHNKVQYFSHFYSPDHSHFAVHSQIKGLQSQFLWYEGGISYQLAEVPA